MDTTKPQVGILGGGQLGCMLADAALALGLSPRILADGESPAAALFPGLVVVGSPSDESALRAFFSGLSVVTFENEFLDCAVLERAASGLPVRIAPGLDAVRELQDKLRQKEWLVRLGIPTAPFVRIEEAGAGVEQAFGRFPEGVVFKWSRLGYDGKGVLICDGPADRERAVRFCRLSLDRSIAVYAESKVAFRRELAIVASRAVDGRFGAFPLVLSEQRRGICYRVLGPATELGVPRALEEQAAGHARRLAEALGLTGSFALELFETAEGGLSVNEIAPRVHNSAHYTLDACPTSQFENHWRAILGDPRAMPLGDTIPKGRFGMLNLLGPEGLELTLPRRRRQLPFSLPPAALRLHWYGKSEVRPLRKVGHVSCVADDASSALEQYHTRWQAELRALAASTERK